MNYDSRDRPTSRVIRPPGGGSSNIFGDSNSSEPVKNKVKTNPSHISSIFASDVPTESTKSKPKQVRRDPITGVILDGEDRDAEENENPVQEKEAKNDEVKLDAKNEQPSDANRTALGVRRAQPPGGRSTFTFG